MESYLTKFERMMVAYDVPKNEVGVQTGTARHYIVLTVEEADSYKIAILSRCDINA